MADPSPADAAEGTTPTESEGQTPADTGSDDGESHEGKEPKTYPEAYVRQLRREAATNRNKLAELEEKLQEREDRDKSEHEKLAERASSSEQRAVEAEAKLLRFEIAAEHGLEPAAVQFLAGTTREEIELRAEELAKLLEDKSQAKPTSSFDGGARQPAPTKGPPEQEHNDFLMKALGRPSSERRG